MSKTRTAIGVVVALALTFGPFLWMIPASQRPLDAAVAATVEIRTSSITDGVLGPDGTGSGVVVDERGYVLTCWHVVEGSDKVVVEWNGLNATASLVAFDAELDLALIKVERQLPRAVVWGDSDALQVGDGVYAIGFPFDVIKLVRHGIIASLDFKVYEGAFLVTDAAINPGDSGGGLFTDDGELIGISARIQTCQGLRANIGIAYAIPGNAARWFVLSNTP